MTPRRISKCLTSLCLTSFSFAWQLNAFLVLEKGMFYTLKNFVDALTSGLWRCLGKQITKKEKAVTGLPTEQTSCHLLQSFNVRSRLIPTSFRTTTNVQNNHIPKIQKQRRERESFTVGQWFIFLFSPGFMWLTNHDSSLNSLSSVTWNVSLYESSLWRQDKTRKLLFIDIRGKWRYLWSWKRPIYVLRFSHAFLSLSFLVDSLSQCNSFLQ